MRIKKTEEAGNRGVVCTRSGLFHGEVSNWLSFCCCCWVWSLYSLCLHAFFFALRRPLCCGSGFRIVWLNFHGGLCARLLFPRVKIDLKKNKKTEEVTAPVVSVWTRTFTRVRVSACAFISLRVSACVCVCKRARACTCTCEVPKQESGFLKTLELLSIVRVSVTLRIHYHQHASVCYKCAAPTHSAANTETFQLILSLLLRKAGFVLSKFMMRSLNYSQKFSQLKIKVDKFWQRKLSVLFLQTFPITNQQTLNNDQQACCEYVYFKVTFSSSVEDSRGWSSLNSSVVGFQWKLQLLWSTKAS